MSSAPTLQPNNFPITSPILKTAVTMFLLRRTAARAVVAAPSAVFVKPRSITTISPAFRLQQHRWIAPSFQRRFASDEAAKPETTTSTAEATETFAQTATEAPVDENLTPAQEAAPAEAAEPAAPADSPAAAVGGEQLRDAAQRRRRDDGPVTPSPTLYIGNLYYQVTAEQLQRVFSRFGEVASTKIVYDNRGLSRGFGYVEFKDIENAKAAIENLDMQIFEGRNLVVQFHRAKENSRGQDGDGKFAPSPPSRTLFIGNMSYEMSDKDLNDLFRDIRNVMDVRVAIDRRTGQPRGFAHADFIDVASATRAKAILSEKTIYGRTLRVDFSRSVPRREEGDRSRV